MQRDQLKVRIQHFENYQKLELYRIIYIFLLITLVRFLVSLFSIIEGQFLWSFAKLEGYGHDLIDATFWKNVDEKEYLFSLMQYFQHFCYKCSHK